MWHDHSVHVFAEAFSRVILFVLGNLGLEITVLIYKRYNSRITSKPALLRTQFRVCVVCSSDISSLAAEVTLLLRLPPCCV